MKQLLSLTARWCVAIALPAIPAATSCKSEGERSDAAEVPCVSAVDDSISAALDYQMANYPCSQYRDVYKNFMQDFFGPGHILADTAAAAKYLRHELGLEEAFKGPLYEKTGYKGNFYRVNLSLIREGVIPYELFFKHFVESVQGIEPPSGNEWMETWALVDKVIKNKGLSFSGESDDRRELMRQFADGDYVVHHSKRYNDSVHFHYRIIAREPFENELLPLIKQAKPQ
ncbi:MAG: hypothetical protein HDR92_09010 [Bacteroides sp.]|nr:hypothetical protein [Bacteroides sp.]MBD5347249.1 hypothetical protein [Bacteroides sp.]